MLYDILPPTIFLLSLGGIILIVGRAGVRLRRSGANVQNYATAGVGAGQAPAADVERSRDVSSLLKPTQKGVQAIKSRATLVSRAVQDARGRATASVQAIRERRQTKAEAKAEAEVTPEPEPTVEEKVETETQVGAISVPTSPMRERLSRFRLPSFRRRISEEDSIDEQSNINEEVSNEEKSKSGVVTRVITEPAVPSPKAMLKTSMRRAAAKPKKKPGSILEQAQVALEAGQFEAAEDLLVPYIVKHSKETKAYILLGQAAIGRQSWEEALEIFEQIISWEPESPGAYAGLGIAAYHAGSLTQSLQALQRAHEADPNNRMILEHLMTIAQRMDNPALQHSISEKIAVLDGITEKAEQTT